jgi:hypothetical protein
MEILISRENCCRPLENRLTSDGAQLQGAEDGGCHHQQASGEPISKELVVSTEQDDGREKSSCGWDGLHLGDKLDNTPPEIGLRRFFITKIDTVFN